MPIKRRLSEKERLKKQLPHGWNKALEHPLMKKLTHGDSGFNPTPRNVIQAINRTKGWKGATYKEKLFVLCLDLIMEKAYGEGKGVIDPYTYNRLQDHMESNQTKMQAESMIIWMTWCWDYYHDHYRLFNTKDGSLELPVTVNRHKDKRKTKVKLKKLSKHK